jgi:diphosphomevalonate decarboxylase
VSALLESVRRMAGITQFAFVESQNNFPSGVGLASSASAFAALSLAASTAAGLQLSEQELSRLARTGSGSACRPVLGLQD